MDTKNCFHCGNVIIIKDEFLFDEKSFCCNGCKIVYEIFETLYIFFDKFKIQIIFIDL
jgi:hypothetical protein